MKALVLAIFLSIFHWTLCDPVLVGDLPSIDPNQLLVKTNEVLTGSASQDDTLRDPSDTKSPNGEVSTAALSPEDYKLSDAVLPLHYDLQITPNFKDQTFKGKLKLTVKAQRTSQRAIVLLGSGLKINETWKVERADVPIVSPKQPMREDPETNKITFPFGNPLDPLFSYYLYVDYTGVMSGDLSGFFRSQYRVGGTVKSTFVTQLAPIAARKLLPCFDEPRFRATFKLTVKDVEGYTVVSNGINSYTVDEEEEDGDMKQTNVYFENTLKPIPVHAFGFFISEFKTASRGSVKLLSKTDSEPDKLTVIDWATKIEKFLSTWFDYPLESLTKNLELVAVPDYAPSAMETLGSIYSREFYLIYDTRSNVRDQQNIIKELSNKLARQWFGIITTVPQWTHVWLRDGISKYLEAAAGHETLPALELPAQFNTEVLQSALRLDTDHQAHPVLPEDLYHPDDIKEILESEIYSKKGAVIMRWIEHVIGQAKFKENLQKLLKNYEDGSLTTTDFLTQMEANVLGSNVTTIFNGWLKQVGYPVVHVHREDGRLKLTQEKFLLKPAATPTTTKWHIPINFVTDTGDWEAVAPSHLLTADSDELEVDLQPDNATFYVVNAQQVGFYRVNYDTDNWNAIKVMLKIRPEGIHVLSRAQIVDDLFNLAEAGHLEYDFAFDILEYLENEVDYRPWRSALNGLARLAARDPKETLADDYSPLFGKYNLWFLENLYGSLGFQPRSSDSHLNKLLRADMIHWLCKFGHVDCNKRALDEYNSFKNNKQNINNDIEQAVLCSAIRSGEDIAHLWSKYLEEEQPAVRLRYLMALTCTRNEEAVNILLDKILTNDIRQHDKFTVFKSLHTENVENVDVALDFIINKWKAWNKVLDVAKTLHHLVSGFTKEEQVTKLQRLVTQLRGSEDITEKQVTLLDVAVNDAKFNLDWNRKRLGELLARMRTLPFLNSAGILGIQTVLLIASTLAALTLGRIAY